MIDATSVAATLPVTLPVSVKVTVEEEWPRVLVTRKILRDKSRYFGPFHSAWAVRESLDAIRKVFPLRTCSDTVFRNRSRPCLEYQIKRCPGPCCLAVDRDEYRRFTAQSDVSHAYFIGRTRPGRFFRAAGQDEGKEKGNNKWRLIHVEGFANNAISSAYGNQPCKYPW